MSGRSSRFKDFSLSRVTVVISLIVLALPLSFAQSHPNAKDLLKQMTLEEKIGQLSQLPGFPIHEFAEQMGNPQDALRKYGAGSVLWVSDPKEMNRWQHIAVDESRLHIPVIFG
ncbi:MAG TPA: hypothetical protein VGS27_18330, partial [Candidatus Sulfotelmatobacter sp.]|nr:hypothetical protein [Candidatus Sulfotelmatobacter sp.]